MSAPDPFSSGVWVSAPDSVFSSIWMSVPLSGCMTLSVPVSACIILSVQVSGHDTGCSSVWISALILTV